MSELRSALDALAMTDLDGLSDGQLLTHVGDLLVASNRINAQLTRAVRRADARCSAENDGAKTMKSWLRGIARVSGSLAGRLVSQGRRLEQLPAVSREFSEGLIGADQVEVLVEIAKPDNLDRAAAQGIDVGEVEAALVELAAVGTHRDLQLAVGEYLKKLDPDGREPDPTEERSVTLVQHPDGSWTLGGAPDVHPEDPLLRHLKVPGQARGDPVEFSREGLRPGG